MRQYHAAKQDHPGCLLFFRLGDFFELFFEDAITASRDLGITLTRRRERGGEPIPMCGVPVHSAETYLAKLLAKGHRVAICDQVEKPSKARKLVRREVVRVLSPGTASDPSILRPGENNYLAAVHSRGSEAGLAYVDVSTGDFRAMQLHEAEVEGTLQGLRVRELLRPESGQWSVPQEDDQATEAEVSYTVTPVDGWSFDAEYAERTLLNTFRLHNLDGLGMKDKPLAVAAAGALVHYLRETQRSSLEHLGRPAFLAQSDCMVLDPLTIRHLEIFDPLFQETRTTLLHALDRTATPMGARLMRSRLLRPSMDSIEIEHRLEAVEELCRGTIARTELQREMKRLHDIERMLARITLRSTGPREVHNLGQSLARIPTIRELASAIPGVRAQSLLERMDPLEDVSGSIRETLCEDPSALGSGGAIADGVDAELDALRDIQRDSRSYISELEQRERNQTGIDSLKVGFNNIFGFFIEVSKANLSKVPEHYDRKQTLVNAERFFTIELKELEARVLDAETGIAEKEALIFENLTAAVVAEATRIRSAGAAIAELDFFCGLAQVAVEGNYSRPRFNSSGEIRIEGGRHPVVERMLERTSGDRFIENDTHLDCDERVIALITGPNMGGKSTYLRQIALISVMAQCGSFVPARSASLPLVDRIFTRIGASDNVALGRSTFMVEMTETAQILNTATDQSLVLLDEIGRGTSTYDGLALAWAVAEHILRKVRAKTLFATHYHELTALPDTHEGVVNLHVSAKLSGDRLVFLRRIQPGRADRSYGIEVARLAGLPTEVVARASEVLANHERSAGPAADSGTERRTDSDGDAGTKPSGMEKNLRSLDLEQLTPFEALWLLHEWKETLGD